MKVINTVIQLAGSRSHEVDFEKLAITRDPAGPFKEREELEIKPGPDNRDITVRAVKDTHVSVIHSVVNTAGVESQKVVTCFQAGQPIQPEAAMFPPLVLDSTEQDEAVGASEQLGVLLGSIEAAGEEETTDGSSAGADGAAATDGGNSEDTSNGSPGAATGDENGADSDSKES